jgi:oligosaccharide repeat unit polymerase
MEIILLIVAFAIIFLIMVVKQNDFVSPSFMFAAPLIVSIFICVIYQNKWNFECRLETFLLIIVGIVLFFCGDQIGNKMSRRKIGYNEKISCDMSVTMIKIVFIILFSLISIYLVYREVSRSVSAAGIAYSLFRTSTKGLAKYSVSTVVSMIMNIMSIISIFGVVVLVNNFIHKCTKRRDWLFVVPIVSYWIIVLMQGQRGDLINFFVSTIFVCFCMNYKKNGEGAKKNIKLARSFVKYFFIILVIFYSLRLTISKPGQENLSFFDTISGYVGAQIDLLNRLVSEKNVSYPLIGYESFHDMYKFFEKIGIMHNLPTITFRYRAYNGLGCNVYTFFRRPYVDFGLIGAWCISLLCGIVWGHFYYKYVRVRNGSRQFMFYLIVYAYFINKVAMSFFDDYITMLISANTAIKLVLLVLINKFMYCKIKIRRRNFR